MHTHNPKPGVLGRIAARLAGVPCIVNTQHGLYAMPEDRLARKGAVLGIEWIAARFSDSELFQSEEDLAWAARLRIARPPKGRLLGNGIDLTLFDPEAVPAERIERLRTELGIAAGKVVVGAVGRMVAEKGYRELFEAAAAVRAAHPEARVPGRRRLRSREVGLDTARRDGARAASTRCSRAIATTSGTSWH